MNMLPFCRDFYSRTITDNLGIWSPQPGIDQSVKQHHIYLETKYSIQPL